jgi:CBS domain-containing protein
MKRRYRPFHLFLALLLIFGVISSGILFFAHTHRSTASFCKTEGEYFQENLEESFKEFEMLPAIAFALNAQIGSELVEPAITIDGETQLKTVLELMEQNHIREIAVINEEGRLVGTLEAKNILSHYLQAKAKSNL